MNEKFENNKRSGEFKHNTGDKFQNNANRRPYSDKKSSFGGKKVGNEHEKWAKPASNRTGDRNESAERPQGGYKVGGEREKWSKPAASHGMNRNGSNERVQSGYKVGNRTGNNGKFGERGGRKPFENNRKPQNRPNFVPKAAPKAAPVSDGLPARRLALSIIRKVTEQESYASLALNEQLTGSGLNPQDRRLAARLVYDTLEHISMIDYALDHVMARPDTDIRLRNVLRLGACQVLVEDRIPESAATNTTVNLCKEIFTLAVDPKGVMPGVCNGVMRSLVRQKDHLVWPDENAEPMKARSIRYSVPEWLIAMLDQDWGSEAADAFLAARPQENITVRPNLTRMNDEEFAALLEKKVWKNEKTELPHAWKISGMADLGEDADFKQGNFSIQSEGSMMACLALAPKRGMQLLDACAAPGGKSCYLSEMMDGTGRVQAWELHEHRTQLIAAQARRLGLDNIRPITRDASKARPEMTRTMDAVLLDAPCSGLGNLADKPDMRLHLKEENIAELVKLQRSLLEALAPCVKPGGILVYSTCSVLRSENEGQVAAFLMDHPEFTLEKLPETIPEKYRAHEDVGLQLLPGRDDTPGFYLARLRRAKV